MYKLLIPLIFVNLSLFSKPIEFIQDFAQFKGDSELTRVEMYYMIDDSVLTYSYDRGGYIGELYINASFTSSLGENVGEEWILSDLVTTREKSSTRILIGQRTFYIKPGQYNFTLSLKDIHDTSNTANFSSPFLVRDFSKKEFTLSDIEFSTKIFLTDTAKNFNQQFKKGQLGVAPNPLKLYAGEEPTLISYLEIYGGRKANPNGFTVSYTVLDAAKREIFTIPFQRPCIADAQVEKIELPLSALPTGTYFLKISVMGEKDSAFSTGRFYVESSIPPEIEQVFSEDEQFLQSEFSTLDESQVKKEVEYIQYIVTESEKLSLKELTKKEALQKFLFRFWKQHDSKPETIINESLESYRKAIAYANKFFSNLHVKEGWRTDRGRVLLKYGFPTQIDRNGLNGEGKPYETWNYPQLQGGGIFVFVDVQGYNNYQLVHSTIPGEVYNVNWEEHYQRIRPNSINSNDR